MPRSGPHRYDAYAKAHVDDVNERNKARRLAIKEWGKTAVQGKDVDHKTEIVRGGTNTPSNIRLREPSDNRGDKSWRHERGYRPS